MVQMPHWPMPPWNVIKYDMERIELLLSALGNPHLKLPPVIHVAGTNGKGSTIAFMRAIFEAAGLKVHVYTSPHLLEFNERIVLASEKIDDDYLFDVLERTRRAAKSLDIECSFFEGTTAAAFLAFSERPADILLLEVGMGGRLDATNVVPRPLLTVITTIAHDHMDYLGNTLPAIAAEKAGIIKPGVPCVISCQRDEVYEVLFAKCEERRAPITAFGADFGVETLSPADLTYLFPADLIRGSHETPEALVSGTREPSLHEVRGSAPIGDNQYFKVLGLGMDNEWLPQPRLLGDHQLINASTAIAAVSRGFDLLVSRGLDPVVSRGLDPVVSRGLDPRVSCDITPETRGSSPRETSKSNPRETINHIKTGLQKAHWPARLQKINDNLWLDGAHNSHGAQVLSIFCQTLNRPISLILGLTKNRNAVDFLTHFQGIASKVFCVQVMSEVSSYSGARLAELAAPAGIPAIACDSLEEALELSKKEGGSTIVTGSLFLAADFLKLAQSHPQHSEC